MVVDCIMYHHTKCYVLYVLQLTLYSNKGLKSSTVVLLLPIPKQSSIALFADDAKCHKQIRTINDCVLLHNDLINLYEWSITWKMTFNASKCKVLSISRCSKPFS